MTRLILLALALGLMAACAAHGPAPTSSEPTTATTSSAASTATAQPYTQLVGYQHLLRQCREQFLPTLPHCAQVGLTDAGIRP